MQKPTQYCKAIILQLKKKTKDSVLPMRGGLGSIPGQGTRIPYAMQCSPKKKKEMMNKNWKQEKENTKT